MIAKAVALRMPYCGLSAPAIAPLKGQIIKVAKMIVHGAARKLIMPKYK
jgi:hypothetical protein